MTHALLVDDDAGLRTLVSDYLRNDGMRLSSVTSGNALKHLLHAGGSAPGEPFDVLLLDLMLPDAHGLDLCRWVCARSALPIIMLTAQGDPASRVVGLELGADDYLPKPFEPRELVVRMGAVLRRSAGCTPEQIAIALSAAEFRLLAAFVDHPRRRRGGRR